MSIAEILAKKKELATNLARPTPIIIDDVKTEVVSKPNHVESPLIKELEAYIKNNKNPVIKRIQARQKLSQLKEEHDKIQVTKDLTVPAISLPSRLQDAPQIEDKQIPLPVVPPKPKETFSLDIVLNARQLEACRLAKLGKSFVFTGAAGTGKTTTARELARQLLSQGILGTHDFKVKLQEGGSMRVTGPSIAIVAYTNRASKNIRRAIHKDKELEEKLRHNICTIHTLLEYEPEYYTHPETGKDTMRFVPMRNEHNKLGITHLVVEEASMLGTALGEKLLKACHPGIQIIYMGDINQLQPVMDKPMLSYALVKLPVIELEEVYRQALDSDIIKAAHMILKGQQDEFIDLVKNSPKKQIKLVGGNKAHTEETLVQALAKSFNELHEKGKYDPNQDMILSPFNKNALGTDNVNNWIAQFLGTKREATVHEVLAGRRKLYLAIGDRVMCNKRDGVITKISINGRYIGKMFQPASPHLSRFGIPIIQESKKTNGVSEEVREEDLFVGYENLDVNAEPTEEKLREASHVVEIEYEDETIDVINTVGDFAQNSFSLGYALTIHKAQGCEWRKVYLILHPNHAVMLHRELFYTAVTRTKEELQIISNEIVLRKCIQNARIKGKSLAEKIEYFNSGALDASTVQVTV